MGFLKRLFGRDEKGPEPDSQGFVRMLDATGNQIVVSREQLRNSILPATLKTHWLDAEQLYLTIVNALQDGFFADVLEAADHLRQLDSANPLYTCVYAIALLQNKQLDRAQDVLLTFLKEYGEDGYVLTNLAKVYAERGQRAQATDTLWHALEVDPNQANALEWYAVIGYEQGGESARIDRWKQVAAFPASWRAQLWLARAALQNGEKPKAMELYQESISRASSVPPADLLMQMTGDLGGHGHLAELVELTVSHFSPEVHGLQVGNNLIKAHLGLRQNREARAVLNRLRMLNQPPWKPTLEYWESELRKVDA
jgi:tetratricopeptide (TPR) repeat protein